MNYVLSVVLFYLLFNYTAEIAVCFYYPSLHFNLRLLTTVCFDKKSKILQDVCYRKIKQRIKRYCRIEQEKSAKRFESHSFSYTGAVH